MALKLITPWKKAEKDKMLKDLGGSSTEKTPPKSSESPSPSNSAGSAEWYTQGGFSSAVIRKIQAANLGYALLSRYRDGQIHVRIVDDSLHIDVVLRDRYKLHDILFGTSFAWLEVDAAMEKIVRDVRVDEVSQRLIKELREAPQPKPKYRLEGDNFELPAPGKFEYTKIEADQLQYIPEMTSYKIYDTSSRFAPLKPTEPESVYPDWEESDWSDDEDTNE